MHIIKHLMAYFDSLSCLVKSIFVSVNLGKNSTILQLKLSNYKDFSHSVRDAFFFQIEHASRKLFKCMFNTLSTLFKHLHLLIAQCHIVEHNEEVVYVSSTWWKINSIHNSISLLQKVQSFFIRFFFNETVSTFI